MKIIKKRVSILLSFVICIQATFFAQEITLNNKGFQCKEIKNINYVPLRSLAEDLGATVVYRNGLVLITQHSKVYTLNIKDNKLIVKDLISDEVIERTEYIVLVNDKTYISLQLFSEILDINTQYNQSTGNIIILTKTDDISEYMQRLKNTHEKLESKLKNAKTKSEKEELISKISLFNNAYGEYRGFVPFSGQYIPNSINGKIIQEIQSELEDVKLNMINQHSTSQSNHASSESNNDDETSEITKTIDDIIVAANQKLSSTKDTELKLKILKETNEQIRIFTNSGVISAITTPHSTHIEDVIEFGEIPEFLGINIEELGINISMKVKKPYFGGSIDLELWGDGKLIRSNYTIYSWDLAVMEKKVVGSAIIPFVKSNFEEAGVDYTTLKEITLKTNMYGDFTIPFKREWVENQFDYNGIRSVEEIINIGNSRLTNLKNENLRFEILKDTNEQIRKINGSSVETSNIIPSSTEIKDIKEYGFIPRLDSLEGNIYIDELGNYTFECLYHIRTQDKPYLGGSIDTELYIDGIKVCQRNDNGAWDVYEYVNRRWGMYMEGSGNIQTFYNGKMPIVTLKTNVWGDINIHTSSTTGSAIKLVLR